MRTQRAGHATLFRRVARGVGLLSLAGLFGCPANVRQMSARGAAGAPTNTADDLPHDGNLSVSLRAVLVNGTNERPLSENETLHSGDHLYFLLRTSQPAYLYVVLFDPMGHGSTLFPVRAKKDRALFQRGPRVAARCPLRIPAEGTFYLQDPAGLQDLRVIASSEPLSRADRRLCEQLKLPCEDVQEQPIPSCSGDAARAIFPSVKVATASPQGVASLRLLLTQEP